MTVKNAYDSMADRFAKYLTEEDCICAEEADAYRFGIEVIFLKLVHIASYLLIAVCMKRVLEFIVIFGIFLCFQEEYGRFSCQDQAGVLSVFLYSHCDSIVVGRSRTVRQNHNGTDSRLT